MRTRNTACAALAFALLPVVVAWAGDPPEIGSVNVVSTQPTRVVLEAGINSHGAATKVHLEFGRTKALGGRTGTADLEAAFQPSPVSFTVTGLLPHTTYYYRVVATSAGGTTTSDIASIVTAARHGLLGAPTVSFAIGTAAGGAYPWRVLAASLPHGLPKGTLVAIRCHSGCHGGRIAHTGATKQVRFHPAISITRKSVLEVEVTHKGYIGRLSRFVFRRSGSLIQASRIFAACLKGSPPKTVPCPT
jgi:hypothetical protein